MKIEYMHASKFGNGAMVAAEFQRLMAAKGVTVDVHHIRDVRATDLSPASEGATVHAIEVACELGAKLLIVSVIDPGRAEDYPIFSRDDTIDVERLRTGRLRSDGG